jgi:23S rRNA A1618 N6-methylase RlmF
MFGWSWIATDISQESLDHAQKLVELNTLQSHVRLVRSTGSKVWPGLGPASVAMSNPPFY